MWSRKKTLAGDEKELLERVLALDERALGMVFDDYYLPLYRYIMHHIGHARTAEDLAAEVFKRLLEAIERGRGPSRYLRAWLYRVARNLAVDELRRFQHRNHEQLDERMVSSGESVPAKAETAILSQEVRAALRKLTPRQRDVIILRYLEGYENGEVAQILGLSVGAVKSLRHRGLAALRRHLGRIGAVPERSMRYETA
jgi:RNA polymerase sigma-70 factor (ECF subfamily)